MIATSRRVASLGGIIFGLAFISTIQGGDWTAPVEVRHDTQRCVSYRARLAGQHLMVQATLDPDWHTFAMDNKERAAEKLAGKKSLGIDQPTEIVLSKGLEVAGPWYQSVAKDFSQPEMRWFSWGFEGQALFATRIRRTGPGPAKIAIHGQACTDTICKNIDIEISLPLEGGEVDADTSTIDFKNLFQVRKK